FAITCQASPPPNNPPVVNAGGNQSAIEAVLYQLNASFTDVDGDGPWTYNINWGDGSSSTGTLSAQGAIGPSHTYVLPGAYTITVTVTDSHGATGSDSKTLNVTL
ncbi:MAG TPA: PKD domain-containing protein, partial [Gemmatimonadales bacterium]|nr:PKD domain-containing protein [Gemmatimonadales bacterium]